MSHSNIGPIPVNRIQIGKIVRVVRAADTNVHNWANEDRLMIQPKTRPPALIAWRSREDKHHVIMYIMYQNYLSQTTERRSTDNSWEVDWNE